jgi:hypothetical protein
MFSIVLTISFFIAIINLSVILNNFEILLFILYDRFYHITKSFYNKNRLLIDNILTV